MIDYVFTNTLFLIKNIQPEIDHWRSLVALKASGRWTQVVYYGISVWGTVEGDCY